MKTSKLFFEKDKRHFRGKLSFSNLSYGLWSAQAHPANSDDLALIYLVYIACVR